MSFSNMFLAVSLFFWHERRWCHQSEHADTNRFLRSLLWFTVLCNFVTSFETKYCILFPMENEKELTKLNKSSGFEGCKQKK